MKRFSQGIAAAVLGLCAGGAWSADCKPMVGHFEARVVPAGEGHCPNVDGAFCTAGRVWGGIHGTYQFVMTAAHPSAAMRGVPTIIFFTGQSVVFLKSGGQMVGTDTGSIDLPPGRGGFASLITFENGQMRLRGELNPAEGTTSGDYIGSLCAP